MKTIIQYLLLLSALPAMLAAQYTGGNGGGSASAISIDASLPVELVSFAAKVEKSDVVLTWQTAVETNNYGFDIERKSTSTWNNVGFMEGHGTTNARQSYSFVDRSASGIVSYRLKQIDRNGSFKYSEEAEVTVAATEKTFALFQNYPNPFNPNTMIQYHVPVHSRVSLKVYNILGAEVATLVDEIKEAGTYSARLDGTKLSSGLYFYTIKADNFTATKKLLLTK